MNFFRLLISALILSGILAGQISNSHAADQPLVVFEGRKKQAKNQAFIISKITSKTIELHRQQSRIDFIGNVVVVREDVEFLADQMVVYYKEGNDKTIFQQDIKKKNQQDSSIKRIDAKNNVKIFHEEFVATGDIGTYDPKAGTFVVEKNVVFNSGTSTATGNRFIYNLGTKKGHLEGKKNYLTKQNNDIQQLKDGRVMVIIDQNDDLLKRKKNKDQEPKND